MPDSVARKAMDVLTRAVDGKLEPCGDGTLSCLLAAMARDGIDMAVMLPIATRPAHYEIILRNALSIMDGSCGEVARQHMTPLASVHPLEPDFSRHREEIASHGIRGVKFHPYYQDFSLADPAVLPMFRKIAELGLVVQCHCGFDVGYPDRFDACGPRETAELLRNVPGLVFVAAHLGGCAGHEPHAADELMDLGCYTDTSALEIDWMNDEQRRVLKAWPKDRLLFGTDFPWTPPAKSADWAASLLAECDREAMLSGNALRILGLG